MKLLFFNSKNYDIYHALNTEAVMNYKFAFALFFKIVTSFEYKNQPQ